MRDLRRAPPRRRELRCWRALATIPRRPKERTKKFALDGGASDQVRTDQERTARFSSFEGRKRGIRPPETFMGCPVRGFLPVRGLRRATEKVPKPTSVTGRPRLSEVRTEERSARRARSAAAFVHPLAVAIEATRSARVMPGHS